MVERYSILTSGKNAIRKREMGKETHGHIQADLFSQRVLVEIEDPAKDSLKTTFVSTFLVKSL